jgi:heat shock protein HslJ
MLRTLILSLVPAIVVTLAAMPSFAAQGTPGPGEGIPPVVWQLTKIGPPSGSELVPGDPSKYTLQFLPDGRVNVRADCNSGQGSYEIDGVELTIDQVAMTLMACEPDSLDTEFASTLAFVNSFAVIFDELIITATDGTTLHFVPSLTGVVWEWQEFLGGNSEMVSPDDPSQYTITFEDESNFTVRADCNVGGGTYTTEGASIEMTVEQLTRAMCPPESLSDQFLRDIDDSASYFFRDGQLNLELMADAGISRFVARPIEEQGTPVPGEGTPGTDAGTPAGG